MDESSESPNKSEARKRKCVAAALNSDLMQYDVPSTSKKPFLHHSHTTKTSSEPINSNQNETFEDTSVTEPMLLSEEDAHFHQEINNNKGASSNHLSMVGDNKSTNCEKMGFYAESHCSKAFQEVMKSEAGVETSPLVNGNLTVSNEKNVLNKVVSLTQDAKVIAEIFPNKNYQDIFKILHEQRDNNNRLEDVMVQLTQTNDANQQSSSTVDIFEEVQRVALAIPSVNVHEVYAILEQLPPSIDRVTTVITKLLTSGIPECSMQPSSHSKSLEEELIITASQSDPFLKNDPLFQDMKIIARMFPEKDRNEIYALLEANVKSSNRIEEVVNEILHAGNESQQNQSQNFALENTSNTNVAEDSLSVDLRRMRNIFPDCDPNYLFEQLESLKDNEDRTNFLATKMFEEKNYPKLNDRLQKEEEKKKIERTKTKLLTMTVDEFLQKFPEPVKTFSDKTKVHCDNYKNNCRIVLEHEFPMLKIGFLKSIFKKHNEHLYLAYQEISDFLVQTAIYKRRDRTMFMQVPRSKKYPEPYNADEYFYHELWFVHNELKVADYLTQKEEERKTKVEMARITGELLECCCCYDNECLSEDMASCPDGHLFCKTCVIRSTEAAFGEMKTKFPCLTGGCNQEIPLSYLQSIIPANLFSKIVRRLQEEEVLQANIPDLVICPFCPFAAIMSNPDDKVFTCMNPECLKESCRLCQEPNHIPLRCNEVEKKSETDMRVYIENQISEAVMRKCHKCGKRFIKDAGCNKMTCVCGATSCYACKAADIDYSHFDNNNKCANESVAIIHKRDMKAAATKAKDQYLLDHPEAANIELKTDIKDMIKTCKLPPRRKESKWS